MEAAESLYIVGEFVGKELQSDVATELQVFRLVHHAHSPPTDPAEDAVVGDRLPHGLGRGGHWRQWYGQAGRGSNPTEVGEHHDCATSVQSRQSALRPRPHWLMCASRWNRPSESRLPSRFQWMTAHRVSSSSNVRE